MGERTTGDAAQGRGPCGLKSTGDDRDRVVAVQVRLERRLLEWLVAKTGVPAYATAVAGFVRVHAKAEGAV